MNKAGGTFNVLFLCTGNSARSILAETIVNQLGNGRFRGFSAGSMPTGRVNPLVVDYLRAQGLPVDGLRSKNWDEFAQPGATAMDFVITVCDNAAGEACPVWPGQPITAHWGVPDPAAVEGGDEAKRAAVRQAFQLLRHRIAPLHVAAGGEARARSGCHGDARHRYRNALDDGGPAGDRRVRAQPDVVGGGLHRRRHRRRAGVAGVFDLRRRAQGRRRSTFPSPR